MKPLQLVYPNEKKKKRLTDLFYVLNVRAACAALFVYINIDEGSPRYAVDFRTIIVIFLCKQLKTLRADKGRSRKEFKTFCLARVLPS